MNAVAGNIIAGPRVLGALRFVEAGTGLPVNRPLSVVSDTATFGRNRSGLYWIASATGLEHFTREFETQPTDVAPGSVLVTATVIDPAGIFLPRTVTIGLPRNATENEPAEPGEAERAFALFEPVTVPLLASPAGPTDSLATIVRVTVKTAANVPVPGALLRVVRASDTDDVLARGMTAWTGRIVGEALVSVPAIPSMTWNDADEDGDIEDDEVLLSSTAVILQAFHDTNFDPDSDDTQPDPDTFEATATQESPPAHIRTATVALALKAGQTITTTILIS